MKTAVRKTIAREVRLTGRGIHAGVETRLALKPAEAGTGIVFRRVDLEGLPTVSSFEVQRDGPPLRTALKKGAAEVHTVEHLLASLCGLGVTDLQVELDAAEVPALDGSAQEFTRALQEAGLSDLDGDGIAPLSVAEPLTVAEGEAHVTIAPYDGLKVSYTLDYPGHPLAQGTAEFEIDAATFLKEIAPARTFCLKQEAEALQKAGFGQGANTQNTVVVDGATAVDTALRFPDEPVRHKILDLLGDLYVLGRPLRGHITAHRSGHGLNRILAEKWAARANGGDATSDEAENNEGQAMGEASATVLDVNAIKDILPHRYPFLLVDRVLEMEAGKRIVGLKNVSANENYFQGHFPGNPIMPGVLILEALAQTGAVLVLDTLAKHGSVVLFAGMDKVAFRRKVVPGDQLRLECTLDRMRGSFGRYHTKATVDGELAAEAVMKFMVDGGKE